MRNAVIRWMILAGLLTCTGLARIPAPAAATASADAMTAALQRNLTSVEREFVANADAMPEAKFAFAPSPSIGEYKGVRTWAQQVKHVAAVNFEVFAALLGKPIPATGPGENGPASIQTKAQIMKYLRDSFAYGHQALATVNQQNALQKIDKPFGPMTRLELAAMVTNHINDHYGQMVEYLRMNRIIPPASRPRR